MERRLIHHCAAANACPLHFEFQAYKKQPHLNGNEDIPHCEYDTGFEHVVALGYEIDICSGNVSSKTLGLDRGAFCLCLVFEAFSPRL